MVDLPSEFRAHVDSYRGPLDLLLFLIKRDEIDIFDIPIARIVEQYQAYMEVLREVDPSLCGEFLVMAAHLMEIKSKMLLPRQEVGEAEEEMEDPRLELVRQLLEYKKYKERALLLERRMHERSRRYERTPLELQWDPADDTSPIDLGNLSIWDLFTAFLKIQLAIGSREPHRVVSADRPIEEYTALIKEFLSSAPRRTARFEEIFADAMTREEAIGYFLAILEMAKERLLAIFQEEIFGPIEVRLREEEELLRLEEEAAAEAVEPAEKFLLEGEGAEAVREPVGEGAVREPVVDGISPGSASSRQDGPEGVSGEGSARQDAPPSTSPEPSP